MRKPHDFYANFELDDFINDDDFVKWVKYPEDEDDQYWSLLSKIMPQKDQVITEAKYVVFLLSRPVMRIEDERLRRVWTNIEKNLAGQANTNKFIFKKMLSTWTRIAAAAVLCITVSYGVFTYYWKKNQDVLQQDLAARHVVAGGNRAKLVLANGKTIDLNNAANGKLAEEAGITVEKTKDGRLIYHTIEADADASSATNTVSTPRGGQYELILPDLTHVWLNAASSIKYPVSFSHVKQRVVELSGEAYFEVTPNKHVPFLVHTANQDIEVLGTHFNVNSYTEEGKTITTLEEGSVKVNAPSSSSTALLKPGQQSVLAGTSLQVQTADLATALAWKNGRIEFKDANIQTIMREVSRWYNIDVTYNGKISDRRFVGSVPRQSNLSTLLALLKLSEINFRIEESPSGKKLIVTPDK